MCSSSSMQISDAGILLSSLIRDSIPAMSTNVTDTTLPNAGGYDSPPVTIILTVTLLVFFLAGFFSVYFCRCFMEAMNNSWNLRHSPSTNISNAPANASALPGLDPSIIQSFPMFVYSDVKDLRKGKTYDLECAICLCEFVGDDSLRLLPSCCHVFHQDCIDLWLKSHKTCPVCRKKLDATPSSSPLKCPLFRTTSRPPDDANEVGSVSITIRDDDELGALDDRFKKVAQNSKESEDKFPRSHSTGHSIVKDRENRMDKYTLELPDDFHSKIIKGHHCTKSCTAIEEYSNSGNTTSAKKKCPGFGEVVTTSIHIDGKLDDVSLVSDGNDKSLNLKNTASTQKDGEFRGEASSLVCDGNDNNLHSRNSSATSRNSVVVRFSDVNDNKV